MAGILYYGINITFILISIGFLDMPVYSQHRSSNLSTFLDYFWGSTLLCGPQKWLWRIELIADRGIGPVQFGLARAGLAGWSIYNVLAIALFSYFCAIIAPLKRHKKHVQKLSGSWRLVCPTPSPTPSQRLPFPAVSSTAAAAAKTFAFASKTANCCLGGLAVFLVVTGFW